MIGTPAKNDILIRSLSRRPPCPYEQVQGLPSFGNSWFQSPSGRKVREIEHGADSGNLDQANDSTASIARDRLNHSHSILSKHRNALIYKRKFFLAMLEIRTTNRQIFLLLISKEDSQDSN